MIKGMLAEISEIEGALAEIQDLASQALALTLWRTCRRA